ncbi:nucleoside-diphosphate-sugar epimerase [Opitutaceae bacterium TAV5]|nr:nucleoside-diphosphate-sugar epimerase [Opitutaceae bacterium TAV5]
MLSDGRPGHENQSIGLAQAVQRRLGGETAATVDVVRFAPGASLCGRIRAARAEGEGAPRLVIAAGHSTHLPLWLAALRFGAPSVVIMKPSLPVWLFDLCFAPRHDLRGALADGASGGRERIVPTLGALNRLPERTAEEIAAAKEPRGLLLLGGPSKHHGWDMAALVPAVVAVLAARPDLSWTIGDSRRTPVDTLERLRAAGAQAQFAPHGQTGPGWLPEQLAKASEAWVTEDSVSMIHEAVTAGARTGVLPVPRLRANDRVARSVDELVAAGYATRFADWQAGGRALRKPPGLLHETGRCAEIVTQRFF